MNRSLILTAAGLVFAAGCQHKCCLNDPDKRPPRTYPPSPNGSVLLPPAGVPTTPGGPLPPGSVPSVAPGGGYAPQPFNPAPMSPPAPSLKPAPEVLYPDPIPSVPTVPVVPGGTSRNSRPGSTGPGVLQGPIRTSPTIEQPAATSVMAGLPGFATVKDGLASGRKPDLDGFATLKETGYKTVIYLYPAGADAAALRELAGKRGLGFNSIETTPESLAKALGAFTAAVADKADRPAYVCDDAGPRAGAVWYLYFRTVEFRSDEEARLLAKPLGLSTQGEEGQAFELAIQQYLANR